MSYTEPREHVCNVSVSGQLQEVWIVSCKILGSDYAEGLIRVFNGRKRTMKPKVGSILTVTVRNT